MKKKNKLSELKALASKTVASETKKANKVLEAKQKEPKAPKAEPVKQQKPIPMPKTTPVVKAKTPPAQEDPKVITKLPTLRPAKRFQAVFKEKDFEALQQAKLFLLENGIENVSNNAIIQAALRAMSKDDKLIKTYLAVANEDQRRKYAIAEAV